MADTLFLLAFLQKFLLGAVRFAWRRCRIPQNRPKASPRTQARVNPSGKENRFASTGLAVPKPSQFPLSRATGFLLCFSLAFLTFSVACGPKGATVILDAEDQFALAKREFEKEHYEQAIIEFQKLVFNYPGAVFIDSAQYLLAMSNFNQEDYPLAVMEFNKLISSFPTSQLSDDAAFMAAFCDFKMSAKAELDQKHTQRAIEELQNFLDDYPTSDRAQEALDLLRESRSKLAKKAYRTGTLYLKMKRYDAALIYLRDVVNEYHDTRWTTPAQFQIAEVYFKQKKYDQAKGEYEKFLENFPQDKLAKEAKQRLKKLNSENSHAKK
jgi:outer membrane protein assembly factor BamD